MAAKPPKRKRRIAPPPRGENPFDDRGFIPSFPYPPAWAGRTQPWQFYSAPTPPAPIRNPDPKHPGWGQSGWGWGLGFGRPSDYVHGRFGIHNWYPQEQDYLPPRKA